MKILFPSSRWEGGTLLFVGDAFKKMGHDIRYCDRLTEKELSPLTYYLKLRQIKKFQPYIARKVEEHFNQELIDKVNEFKPDILFSQNCVTLLPETLEIIREKFKVCTISWVADNPFDSKRFKYYPLTLKYYDYLFLGERIWEQNIRNLAPNSKIYHLVGAFSPDYFKPVYLQTEDLEKYGCNLAFAGASYQMRAEGIYRAGIIAQVADLGVKIWGDDGWKKYFRFYPELEHAYQGKRLNFTELNKMYQAAKINLNIPNPQCITSFQQRIFEIAACRGFQIVDYRTDIDKYFTEDEIITFKNIGELREKICYFLEKPDRMQSSVEKVYNKVIAGHSYELRLKEVLDKINL